MMDTSHRRTGGALFLLSIGITAHQIALMQILSYVQWYHFAYMVVALALLGFGASGTFFALWRQQLLANSTRLLPILMLACGLGLALATIPSSPGPLRFDLYLLFVEPSQILRLITACLLYSLPFFFGGLAIALALTAGIKRTGFLYFANLSGSGAGGLIGLGLTTMFLPEQLPPLIGLFPVAAGLLLLPWRNWGQSLFTVVLPLGSCLILFFWPPQLLPSQFKDISRIMNLPEAEILVRHPNPQGLTQVVAAKALRQAPGLSFQYQGSIPNYAAVLLNGDAYGSLAPAASERPALLDYSTEVLGYLLTKPNDVLLLQPRGGDPIVHALIRGAKRIIAVEPHHEVNRLLAQGVAGFAGYASYRQVKLLQTDPRAFLAETAEQYDLIRLPMVGAFGSNIGLYALSEQFLLTRQSFELAWQRLKPDGVMMVSVWMDYPVKNPLKLLATLIETVDNRAGLNSSRQHIAALRSWGMVTFALKKTPVTGQDTREIRKHSAELGFDPLLLPDIRAAEQARFHRLQDGQFFRNIEMLFTERRQQLYQSYEFNITPATDNQPYFSQFLRFSRLAYLAELLSLRQLPFFEMGSFILAITLIILVLLAIVLIILPLFRLGWHRAGSSRTFVYFGGLGLGYMMLEIVFIQGLTLFLGHPLMAAATVLCALLFFSGLGSLYSERISPQPANIRLIAGLVCLGIVLYGIILIRVGGLQYFGNIELRIFTAALAIAPIGFILGMPFPLGLRRLYKEFPEQIPWAWGINGCFSVIGPALATVVAVQSGFQMVYVLAASAYFLALCSVRAISERR
ncbi:MAG: spermidine synthase-like protein [Thermodesulfobacteriota bacterium]